MDLPFRALSLQDVSVGEDKDQYAMTNVMANMREL